MAQLRRKSVSSMGRKLINPIAAAMNKAKHSGFYHDLSLRGKNPLRLLGTPKDLWPGSVTAGTQMVAGKIIADGCILDNPDNEQNQWPEGEIWLAQALDEKWLEYLHSFKWLKDLNQAVDLDAAKNRAQKLVETWLDHNTQWGEISWRADVIGERVTNWLIYAPLIMDSEDVIFRGRVLDNLARSARHLMKASSSFPDGPDHLKAIIGLILSGMYIPFGDKWFKEGLTLLKYVVGKEVLVDGGIRTRNPHELLHLFMNMTVLRNSIEGMGQKAPDELQAAIKRMALNLRSLIHGDGKLSLFNGATIQNHEDIFSCLLKIKEEIAPLNELKQSGFIRMETGKTVIIQDVGPPAEFELSKASHAGALSFEMSRGKTRIIVNCGDAGFDQQIKHHDIDYITRSTVAHSTLSINGQDSSEICDDGLIGEGISNLISHRYEQEGHVMIEASHDGYEALYGFKHHRLLYLNNLGEDLRGEDLLERSQEIDNGGSLPFAARFHLHPNVSIELNEKKNGATLQLINGEVWQFLASGAEIAIEDSLYFGDAGKKTHCKQIILSGNTRNEETKILWSFRLESA